MLWVIFPGTCSEWRRNLDDFECVVVVGDRRAGPIASETADLQAFKENNPNKERIFSQQQMCGGICLVNV